MKFTLAVFLAAITATGAQARHSMLANDLGRNLEVEELNAESTNETPIQDAGIEINPSTTSKTKTYIITFADDNVIDPAMQCAQLAKSNGGTVRHVYEHIFNGCSIAVPLLVQEGVQTAEAAQEALLMALSNNPAVIRVEEDRQIIIDPPIKVKEEGNHTSQIQDVTVAGASSWGLDRINQCALPLDGITTKLDATGVMVFIMDTGIFADHEEFKGIIDPDDDCHFTAFDDESPFDDGTGHGTHVAGTACGVTYGVSSNCRLCSVKKFDKTGSSTKDQLYAAIDHVVAKCKDPASLCVVNMSFGDFFSFDLNRAVAKMVEEGIVVVAAAGNDAANACYNSPGSELSAITVGSTNKLDALSSFSNWGQCVDVYAPGSIITSAYIDSTTSIETWDGTSMAAPHVTGIAAAIRSAHKSWNPAQVRNAIVNSAATLPSGVLLATAHEVSCHTPCPSGQTSVEIMTFTGVAPKENTTWTVKKKGFIINSPEYKNSSSFVWYSTPLCLPRGTYEFIISGVAEDYPYSKYGFGSYAILVDGHSKHSGVFHQSGKETIEINMAKSGKIRHLRDSNLGRDLEEPVPATDELAVTEPTIPPMKEDGNHTFQVQAGAVAEASSWGLDRINQCALPLDGITMKQDAMGVMVFIVGSGIYAAHEEFNGIIDPDDDCHFTVSDEASPLIDERASTYSTAMASTACGATFGVSSNCRLCSANIYDENGIFDESGIFDAFDHIRAKCRNDSESPCVAVIGHVRFNTEYNDAVAKMVADGVVVVTSAGNQARDAGTLSPASEPSVITVGATTDLDALLNTSNWGPFVDIYAPGSNITCAGLVNTTYFRTRSGTELAAAHVTGIAAAIRSAHKSWNPAQVRNAIVNSAVTLPSGVLLATAHDVGCPNPCPSGQTSVEVRVLLGDTPNNTTWTLKKKGFIINNPTEYFHHFVWYSTPLCLPRGTYEFTIAGGTGEEYPYSKYGYGSFEIAVGGRPVHSGVVFYPSDAVFVSVKK